MAACDAPHPERPELRCDKSAPCYGYHANAPANTIWDGTPLPPSPVSVRSGSAKARLALMARRAR